MHSRMGFLYTRVHRDLDSVPGNVKLLAAALFVHMLPWGIIDPFLSIIVHNIVGSYSVAGLVFGIFSAVGIFLSIPIGDLAGKVNRVRYVFYSMLSYPAIGLLYLFSALHAGFSVLLIFAARLLHGFSCLFWIMAESFIREKSPRGQTSAVFGLLFTVSRLAYIIAPLFSVPLIVFFALGPGQVHWLLLFLVPFPFLAAFLAHRLVDRGKKLEDGIGEVVFEDGIIRKELQDLNGLGLVGYFSLLLGFLMEIIREIIAFLIPLYALSLDFTLVEIAILFSLLSIPYLFSFFFAEIADSFGKARTISIGFGLAALSLIALSYANSVSVMFFAAAFSLAFIVALIRPAVNGLITDITPRVQDGEITGILTAVIKAGSFFGVVFLGILSDLFTLHFPFLVFGIVFLAMSALTYAIKSRVVVRI